MTARLSIPTNLRFRVEMWDRHNQHIRWVMAASSSVAIGHAALDTSPTERFTLRKGFLLSGNTDQKRPPATQNDRPTSERNFFVFLCWTVLDCRKRSTQIFGRWPDMRNGESHGDDFALHSKRNGV
jgi:hypothetical protein